MNMEKESKEVSKKVSSTDLYIQVIEKQIEYCETYPSKYGILYDKGFKDGLRKSIGIMSTIKKEVIKDGK